VPAPAVRQILTTVGVHVLAFSGAVTVGAASLEHPQESNVERSDI
jgi:hypothetical protein